MAVAALVEIKRLRTAHSHGPTVKTLPLGFYLLIPQYLIVGIGEALIYTGQLDFFRECPKGMKTMSILSTLALGSLIHPWIADDLNKGRLYNFYWLVAVVVFLNFLIFLVFSKWYVYKDKRLADLGIELEDEPDIPMGHA
ncbi:hypothetical protein Bca52824_013206 [Brassica carinata]|uniref:Uncharacterized protein n=1 Tax=Brassica carinata TaxID=52824 RepID=A0A8X7W0C7_BRACI|nr:hypothetical protein Bca52824_013206 [Brassica carinata]